MKHNRCLWDLCFWFVGHAWDLPVVLQWRDKLWDPVDRWPSF